MKRSKRLLLLGILSSTVLIHASRADVLHAWAFDDPAGTELNGTENTATAGVTWDASFENSATTRDGVFRIQRPTGGPSNAYVDIGDITEGRVWLVMDVAGWNYSGPPNETIRFGFVNQTHETRPHVTAQIRIERKYDDEVVVGGDAFLTGEGATLVSDRVLFSAQQDEPVTFVLELDMDHASYEIFYKVGQEPYTSIGDGRIAPDRAGRYLRLGAAGYFVSTPDERFDIDQIYLTTTDPMTP